MRKRRFPYVIALVLCASTILFTFHMFYVSPPERMVKRFLDDLITHANTRLYSLLAKHINKEHPFIKLALEQKPFLSFKITETKTITKGVLQSWVSLYLKEGSIIVPITVGKTHGTWYVQSLPTVVHLPAAIPIVKDETAKHTQEVLLDVAGDHLLCTNTLPSHKIQNLTPSDIILVENQVVDVRPLKPIKLSKIMAISRAESYIEDASLGKLSVANGLPVYHMQENSLSYRGNMAVLVGSTNSILFHAGDGIGRALIAQDPIVPKDGIRVLIRNSENKAIQHSQLIITCNTNFIAETLIQSISHSFMAGDVVTIKPSEVGTTLYLNGQKLMSSPHRWYIRPSGEGTLSILNNPTGRSNSLSAIPYRGILEVTCYNNGLVVVNELSLEEYLYSVVPSEMPVKFGLEALKVQAIASRSYAIRCFTSEGYAAFGAHVDDSTASQVYNSVSEQSIAVQAVNDTYGLVAFFEGQVIDARFFSTSCGYTANFHEVWSDRNHNFPSQEVPYLVSRPQFPSNIPNLHNEENFRAFINQKDLDGYDRFSPFFRWSVTMKREELEASIQYNLTRIQQTDPAFVLTRKGDGEFVQEEIPLEIGQLQNLQVTRRGQGGNIMELEITTTHGVFKVKKEYNIRQVLQPVNHLDSSHPITLYCYDGSVRDNFPILPSAFAYIDLQRDNEGTIQNVTISGGGYGHGVGMSQYGTYGMSLLGYPFEQIIQHYYPGSELRNIYLDS